MLVAVWGWFQGGGGGVGGDDLANLNPSREFWKFLQGFEGHFQCAGGTRRKFSETSPFLECILFKAEHCYSHLLSSGFGGQARGVFLQRYFTVGVPLVKAYQAVAFAAGALQGGYGRAGWGDCLTSQCHCRRPPPHPWPPRLRLASTSWRQCQPSLSIGMPLPATLQDISKSYTAVQECIHELIGPSWGGMPQLNTV